MRRPPGLPVVGAGPGGGDELGEHADWVPACPGPRADRRAGSVSRSSRVRAVSGPIWPAVAVRSAA